MKRYIVSIMEWDSDDLTLFIVTPEEAIDLKDSVIPGALVTLSFLDSLDALAYLEKCYTKGMKAVLTVEPIKFEVTVKLLEDAGVEVGLFHTGYINVPFELTVEDQQKEEK